jgi:hypothetical protein
LARISQLSSTGEIDPRGRTVCDGLLCALFAIAIATPLGSVIARRSSPKLLAAENRSVSEKPSRPRTWSAALRFPSAYEAWWNDVFGGRETLLRGDAFLQWFVLRRSPAELFFRGRDDWLFYTGDDSRACWLGLRTLSAQRKNAWCKALEERRTAMRGLGIEYLYAIVPNKQTIYPEYLPPSERSTGSTPLEQLVPWMRAHSDAPVLDLRPALFAEKEHDRPEIGDFAYHKLGSHWSARGAWAATRAILETLSQRVPALKPPDRADYVSILRAEPEQDDEVALRLHLQGFLREPSFAFAPKNGTRAEVVHASSESLPRSMEFVRDGEADDVFFLHHDSFGPELRAQLAECVPHLVTRWRYSLPIEEVLIARPRIVVQALTERFLRNDPIPNGGIAPILERAEFEKLSRARTDLDGAAMLAAIRPRAGTDMHLETNGGRTSLWIRTSPENEIVILPETNTPDKVELALRVELTSPERSALSVWYRRVGDGPFDYQRRVVVAIEAGHNDVCFRIPVERLIGSILLRPGFEPGDYRLHAIDARFAPR